MVGKQSFEIKNPQRVLFIGGKMNGKVIELSRPATEEIHFPTFERPNPNSLGGKHGEDKYRLQTIVGEKFGYYVYIISYMTAEEAMERLLTGYVKEESGKS